METFDVVFFSSFNKHLFILLGFFPSAFHCLCDCIFESIHEYGHFFLPVDVVQGTPLLFLAITCGTQV